MLGSCNNIMASLSPTAFFFLYKDVKLMSDGSEILDYKTLPGSIMSLIHMTFGDFNVSTYYLFTWIILLTSIKISLGIMGVTLFFIV